MKESEVREGSTEKNYYYYTLATGTFLFLLATVEMQHYHEDSGEPQLSAMRN